LTFQGAIRRIGGSTGTGDETTRTYSKGATAGLSNLRNVVVHLSVAIVIQVVAGFQMWSLRRKTNVSHIIGTTHEAFVIIIVEYTSPPGFFADSHRILAGYSHTGNIFVRNSVAIIVTIITTLVTWPPGTGTGSPNLVAPHYSTRGKLTPLGPQSAFSFIGIHITVGSHSCNAISSGTGIHVFITTAAALTDRFICETVTVVVDSIAYFRHADAVAYVVALIGIAYVVTTIVVSTFARISAMFCGVVDEVPVWILGLCLVDDTVAVVVKTVAYLIFWDLFVLAIFPMFRKGPVASLSPPVANPFAVLGLVIPG
jgi:hypothetical protein